MCYHIENKRWNTLKMKLETSELEKTIEENTDNEMLLLACQNGAPFEIIIELISIKSVLLHKKDDATGRTPLHMACSYVGSRGTVTEEHFRIIALLATQYPKAASMKDSNGMTPLHLFCQVPCTTPEALDTIDVLCETGPAALTMTNCDGDIPMELFLISQKCRSY